MYDGILGQARRSQTVYVVPMGEVKFYPFGESGRKNSIGTAELGGCSTVMIVSPYAAILAHIPPRPSSNMSDVGAGDRNCQKMMDQVAALYDANQNYFPQGNSWVLCAVYEGEVALPDQQKIMADSLVRLGLSPSQVTYAVGSDGGEFPGQGTVYIDGSGPSVYVEDKLVYDGGQSADQKVETSYMSIASTSQYPTALQQASSYASTSRSLYAQQASSYASTSQSPIQYSQYASTPIQTSSYASTSQSPIQYSQSSSAGASWVYLADDVIWLSQKGDYYYFRYNGKKYETKRADWKQEQAAYEGRITPCWVYTGKQTGTKYYRWSMDGITTTRK